MCRCIKPHTHKSVFFLFNYIQLDSVYNSVFFFVSFKDFFPFFLNTCQNSHAHVRVYVLFSAEAIWKWDNVFRNLKT
jgi:hypothetical protein